MIEIRVFDWTIPFTRLAVTYGATSVEWTKNHYADGSFMVTIPVDANGTGYFKLHRMISIGGEFYGIIRAVKYESGNQGDIAIITGRCLKSIAYNRITVPYDFSEVIGLAGYDAIVDTPTETIMKRYMAHNFNDSLDPARRVEGLMIAPDLGRGEPLDKYATRFQVLGEALRELGEAAKLGYDITPLPDMSGVVFDVVEGIDRTAEQSANPRVFVDTYRGKALSMAYEYDEGGMYNLFYATMSGAEYADEAFTMAYSRDDTDIPSGILRRERHMDISAEHPEAGQEYAELKRLALIEAANYEAAESFNAVTSPGLVYGRDYNLGDIVTVRHGAWDITQDKQITSVTMRAGEGGVSYTVSFGNERPNVFERLAYQISKKKG